MVVRVRILRSWALGLYIAAQVIGLVPLIYEHTLNVYKVGARVGRRKSVTRAAPVSALASPLAFMTRVGDGIGVRLIRSAL
jgi:hypothetical protein